MRAHQEPGQIEEGGRRTRPVSSCSTVIASAIRDMPLTSAPKSVFATISMVTAFIAP